MNRSLLPIILACSSLTSAADPEAPKPPPPAQEAVRLKFVPGGGPWKGEAPFQGASWTALGPGWAPGVLQLHARAGIGDRFPVQEGDGVTICEVVLVAGNDDRLLVDVLSRDGPQKVELPRDKPAKVEVAGVTYQLLYPSTSVAAAKNEKPATNKATIFVSRRL